LYLRGASGASRPGPLAQVVPATSRSEEPVFGWNHHSTPQRLQPRCIGFTCDLDHIDLGNMRRRLHQPMRQIAIIGKQEQTLTGIVEPAHWIHASPDAMK